MSYRHVFMHLDSRIASRPLSVIESRTRKEPKTPEEPDRHGRRFVASPVNHRMCCGERPSGGKGHQLLMISRTVPPEGIIGSTCSW